MVRRHCAGLGHRIAERVDPTPRTAKIADRLARGEREARRLRSGTRFVDGHGSVFYRFRVPTGDDAFIWPVLDTLAVPEPAGDGTPESIPPAWVDPQRTPRRHERFHERHGP